MDPQTFTADIKLQLPVFNDDTEKHEIQDVLKTATFKELSRTDKEQHKLHFMLLTLYSASDGGVIANSDQLYDIAVRSINLLLITDTSFTEQDKLAFLNDSVALMGFAGWYLREKITPFFFQSMKK